MKVNRKLFFDYIKIFMGAFLVAFATNVFYETNDIAPGGITGLSIIIQHWGDKIFNYPIPLWLTTIVLNIPLLIAGLKTNGKKFIFRTVVAIIFLSCALAWTKNITIESLDLTLSAVFGGVFIGTGLGLVFRSSATTGGTDLASSIINSKNKHIPIAAIMFSIDAVVICLGFFSFGPQKALYAIIAEFITSRVVDMMLEGFLFAKSVFIISEHTDEIASRILNNLSRGVTSLSGIGMYTKKEKNILFCAMTNKQIFTLKSLINEIDPKAFVIVTDAREVLGQGFREIEC